MSSGLILPKSYVEERKKQKHRLALDNLRHVLTRSCEKRGWAAIEVRRFVEEVMDQAAELDRLSKDDIIFCLRVKIQNREREIAARATAQS